jgi:hypothetical protein
MITPSLMDTLDVMHGYFQGFSEQVFEQLITMLDNIQENEEPTLYDEIVKQGLLHKLKEHILNSDPKGAQYPLHLRLLNNCFTMVPSCADLSIDINGELLRRLNQVVLTHGN